MLLSGWNRPCKPDGRLAHPLFDSAFRKYPFNVRSFFTDQEKKEIGSGIVLWRGYFQYESRLFRQEGLLNFCKVRKAGNE